jgi:hypothetical protein
LLSLLAGGCGEDLGTGEIVGSLVVPDCESRGDEERWVCAPDVPADRCEAFDLGVDFFALEHFEDSAVIRMQEGGQDLATTDGLLIEIRDVRLLRGQLGQGLEIGPRRDIRAALILSDTCPESTQSFDLRGRIVFTDFGIDKGDRVAARIEELVVRDARTGALLGRLRGSFEFTLRRGPPYQRFIDT